MHFQLQFPAFRAALGRPLFVVTLAGVLLLFTTGCKKTVVDSPMPRTDAVVTTGVPSAASVVTPQAAAPDSQASAGRANNSMTRAEESSAMPLPGQNNDHSAPVAVPAPAKRP